MLHDGHQIMLCQNKMFKTTIYIICTHNIYNSPCTFTSHSSMTSSFITSLLLLSLLSTTLSLPTHSLSSLCKSTPYPNLCFTSLKPSININIDISPNIITYLLQSLQFALSEARNLSNLFSKAGPANMFESRKGAIQDCRELHEITLLSLQRSASKMGSADAKKYLADARTLLSAALTNKVTCSEGLDSVSGPLKPVILESMTSTYKHVSNCLSFLSQSRPLGVPMKKKKVMGAKNRRKLMSFPNWLSAKDRYLLDADDNDGIVVAKDGSGQFTTISDAINFAPNNSDDRVIIYVKSGVYEENVEIQSYKTNIVLLGDGTDVTVITGNRSVVDGWTTFRSATVAVSGTGFLARDITFENTAGPAKHQAVALRINADYAAVYRCIIDGYQDTLYAHSFRQFYRECDIYGTIDYIFGNAGAVFQACNIITKMPLPGQGTVITAQSRDTQDQTTGFSIQNCSVITTDDFGYNTTASGAGKNKSYIGRPLRAYSGNSTTRVNIGKVKRYLGRPLRAYFGNSTTRGSAGKVKKYLGRPMGAYSDNKTTGGNATQVKSYLGRPWRAYSRTVFMESYVDDFINPKGWDEWSPNDKNSLNTLYYGEYENYGPGSGIEGRVAWSGYHKMEYDDAYNFTVSELISGEEWLDSTSFPYDDGV